LPLSFLKLSFPPFVNLKNQNNYSYLKQLKLIFSPNTVENTKLKALSPKTEITSKHKFCLPVQAVADKQI